MLIHQIKLPYFPDIPHVLQESPTPKESQLCDTNGHLAARTRVRDRVRAAAHAEVPSVHGIALDKCASLNLIPHFLEMMSIPKAVSSPLLSPPFLAFVLLCSFYFRDIT
jgi:hypothetical protein